MSDIHEIKIGFIGFGNMAQAMAAGLLRGGQTPAGQIFACARDWDKLCRNTQPFGMIPVHTADELVRQADVVVLAVKPYQISDVVRPIGELLAGKIVISLAAGYPFDRLEQDLLPGTNHLSTVPNTPVSVGEGIIICEQKHSLTAEEYGLVEKLFAPLGLMQPVETHLMGIAGTVSGCGPAFVSMFMEALGDAGVMHGLPRATAYRLAGQMVAGTGKLLVERGDHPGAMKDAVCSPAGTTIVVVAALERKGLRSAVIDAVDAIQNKK